MAYHCNIIADGYSSALVPFVQFLERKINGWGYNCYIPARDFRPGVPIYEQYIKMHLENKVTFVAITSSYTSEFFRYMIEMLLDYQLHSFHSDIKRPALVPVYLNIDHLNHTVLDVIKPVRIYGSKEDEWEDSDSNSRAFSQLREVLMKYHPLGKAGYPGQEQDTGQQQASGNHMASFHGSSSQEQTENLDRKLYRLHNSLMTAIKDELVLDSDEYQKFIYHFGTYVGRGALANKSLLDQLEVLVINKIITRGENYEHLKQICGDSGNQFLVPLIENYEKQMEDVRSQYRDTGSRMDSNKQAATEVYLKLLREATEALEESISKGYTAQNIAVVVTAKLALEGDESIKPQLERITDMFIEVIEGKPIQEIIDIPKGYENILKAFKDLLSHIEQTTGAKATNPKKACITFQLSCETELENLKLLKYFASDDLRNRLLDLANQISNTIRNETGVNVSLEISDESLNSNLQERGKEYQHQEQETKQQQDSGQEYQSQVHAQETKQQQDSDSKQSQKDSCIYDGRLILLDSNQVNDLEASLDKEPIGRGRIGIVYRCNNPDIFGIHVAVKKINTNGDSKIESQVRREKIACRLMNPFILPLLAVVEKSNEKREFWFVSPLCENGDLYEILKHDRTKSAMKLNAKKRVKILLQVALAIQHIHTKVPDVRAVILHKDIASKNIVLDDMFNARLIDFGLAREEDDISTVPAGGRIYYSHPNVGKTKANESWDYYSFGVIVREMITTFGPEGDGTEYLKNMTAEGVTSNICDK